jgi:uncharacterized protein (TIGR02145 family)
MRKLLAGLLFLTATISIQAEAQSFWNRIPILNYIKDYNQYDQKVRADGGYIYNPDATKRIVNDLNKPYASSQVLSISSFSGVKTRTSGVYNYVTKSHDLTPRQQLYGPELVSNGGFASSTGWNVVSPSEIINGEAHIVSLDGSSKEINQLPTVVIGKLYQVTYSYRLISGQCKIQLGSGASAKGIEVISVIGSGTKTVQLWWDGTNNQLYLIRNGSSTCDCYLDNVSIREVLTNDLTQTTAVSQPPLVKIAPNEIPYLSNPNGGSNYLTHPLISFGATQDWSAEWVGNINGSTSLSMGIFGKGVIGNTNIIAIGYPSGRLFGYDSSGTNIQFLNSLNSVSGKTTHIFLVKSGSVLSLYINGVFNESKTIDGGFDFANLFNPRTNTPFNGKIYLYSVWATALPPPEISRRYSVIRSLIPEKETVQIGTQRWCVTNEQLVTTPGIGNVIPEVTANGNTEKVTNGTFDTSTGWTSQWDISSGKLNLINAANLSYSYQSSTASVAGKWYKIIYTIDAISSGGIKFISGDGSSNIVRTTTGTFIEYVQALSSGHNVAYLQAQGITTATIDNVSVQEVGWSGSADLYAGLITQGYTSYNATKACAMWSHYNNDPLNGVIYGKLYNWFAVSLIDQDITAYNAANPTTPYGYHVPTSTEFTTLQTYLGGSTVAGGKLKYPGTSFWTIPNTGADNSSGFSALPGSLRENTGLFGSINLTTGFWSITDGSTASLGMRLYLIYSDATTLINETSKSRGYSLRLIKD